MSGDRWPAPLPTTRDIDAEAEGYRAHAQALAPFVDRRLVNRVDVWGAYWPRGMRETLGKVYTAPRVKDRGRVTNTPRVIARHFAARDEGDVIGLHSTSATDTSRFLGFDIDRHSDAITHDITRDAAVWLTERLAERGAAVLLEDSDGDGGYHVWIYFDAPVPTPAVFAWARHLADECTAATGLRPETFPKQATAAGAYGNWLRLFGRHHTRAHWSRVCRPGEAWSAGSDAARCLLAWPATPADVVPPLDAWPVEPSVQSPPTSALSAPRVFGAHAKGETRDPDAIVAAYVRALPHGEAGSARSDRLFSLCRFLRGGMGYTAEEAFPIIHRWNMGNRPPLNDVKVCATWENAGKYANRPVQLRVDTNTTADTRAAQREALAAGRFADGTVSAHGPLVATRAAGTRRPFAGASIERRRSA
jgi:hypothetical protein